MDGVVRVGSDSQWRTLPIAVSPFYFVVLLWFMVSVLRARILVHTSVGWITPAKTTFRPAYYDSQHLPVLMYRCVCCYNCMYFVCRCGILFCSYEAEHPRLRVCQQNGKNKDHQWLAQFCSSVGSSGLRVRRIIHHAVQRGPR